jgi:phage terminase large subunit-like protein
MIQGNPKKDNGVLKSISLVNGTEINILTYDQGYENISGANPDWIWLDEEPVNTDVVTEILARTRVAECEMLVTMTPLNGLTRIYEFFFNVESANVKRKSRVYLVSSLDNPFIDKTWAEGLTEDEYRLRVLGSFESPTGLVYSSFHRTKCTIPHFDPKDMGEVKYYRGLDFGVSHPTGCVMLAVDTDDNVYVWDEVYRSNTLVEDLAREITQKTGLREIEYTVRDSASKREGIEIARY